jgi:hypothetical protein
MQTRTYGDLFSLIQALAGVSSFVENEKTKIASLINRRYSQAYNTSPSWPRYLVISEGRDINAYTLSGATSGTSTLVNQNYKLLGQSTGTNTKAGTNVYQGVTTSSVIIYKNSLDAWVVATNGDTEVVEGTGTITVTGTGVAQFTEADTNKKDKLEDVSTFTAGSGSTDVLLVEPKNLIPYQQTGKEDIAEFVRIHRRRAFLNLSRVEYDFYVDVSGANIMNITSTVDNEAFRYLQERNLFCLISAQAELLIQALVLVEPFGTSTEAVPLEFFSYLAHATYADFLRMDGQHGKALTEEQVAEGYLFTELEKIDLRSNNNTINKKFTTYVNRQSR